MESSLDSSASAQWSNSSGSHTKGDVMQINELKLKNIHLQEMNNQLQSSLDGANKQLQQALITASLVDGLRDEITSLKSKLADVTDASNIAKHNYKSQIAELNSSLEDEKARSAKQIEGLNQEIKRRSHINKKVTCEKDSLINQLEQVESEMQIIVDQLAKTSNTNKKLREKNKALQRANKELEGKCKEACGFVTDLANENSDKDNKLSSLADEIAELKRNLQSSKDELETKTNEISNYIHAIDLLEIQYNQLKEDFDSICNERTGLIQLVQKLHTAICNLEDHAESLKLQNSQLSARAKKAAAAPDIMSERIDINELSYPFTGEMAEKVNSYLSMNHFLPAQRMQLIINEVAKAITAYEQVISVNMKKHQTQDAYVQNVTDGSRKMYNLLFSLVRALKNLECHEQRIDETAFCESDPRFIDFVVRETAKFDELPDPSVFLGGDFKPTDIFAEENDEVRKKTIEDIFAYDRNLSTLLAVLFLLNQRLNKQIEELTGSVSHRDTIADLLKELGVTDFTGLPNLVKRLQGKIEHLKQTRKEIHTSLVNARNSICEKELEQDELKKQIGNLESRVGELTVENTALKLDIARRSSGEEGNSEAIQEKTEIGTVEEELAEFRRTIESLRKALKEKSDENEQIREEYSAKISNMQRDHERMTRRAAQHESSLSAKNAELQTLVDAFEEKFAKDKRKEKRAMKAVLKKTESQVSAATAQFESERAAIQQALNEAKIKAEKATALASQLQEQLDRSETNNKQLSEANSTLTKSLRTLEMKTTAVQEQAQRDKKAAADTNATALLGAEAKHQKELKELKKRMEEEKKHITDFIANSLGSLYGLSEFEYDEGQCSRIFGRIHSDLARLQYFQEQATKL